MTVPFILCSSRFRIRQARKPLRVDPCDVGGQRCGFLLLRPGIGLRLLLGQLIRMHHDEPEFLHSALPITILHLHLPADAVAMPAPGRLSLRPPGLLYEEGQGGLRAPPGFEFLPDCTGTGNQRHHIDLMLQTQAQGAATIGFTNHRCNPTLTPTRYMQGLIPDKIIAYEIFA